MSIKLKGSSDGSVSFDAPADTSPSGSDITLVLPTTVGSAEQFLKNSGTAGTLEFSSMVETSTGNVQARRARSNTAGDVALSVQPSDSTIHYGLRIDSTNNSLNLDRASGTAANLLVIDSSGRVGIGTTATQQTLTIDVNDSGTTQASFNGINIANTNTTANNGSAITFGQTVAGNSNARIGVIQTARGPSESQEMFFGLLGSGSYSERMRIDSSGNVGIGTTSPGDQLHIHTASSGACNVRFSSTDVSSGFFVGFDGQEQAQIWHTANKPIRFASNNTERMRIDSSGRLLLGLTSSIGGDAIFQVQGSGNRKAHFHQPDSGGSIIQFTNTTTGTGTSDGFEVALNGSEDGQIWLYESGNIKFGTANSERVRILSGGGLTFNGDTAAANALDDYEEGTFTPTYLSGLSSPSYSDTTGTYTKIGNLVTFTLRISATGTNVGSHARIGSLPFTSSSSDEGSASFGFFGNLSGNQSDDVYLHIAESNNIIEFYYASGAQFLGNGGNGLSGRTLHIRGFYYA